MDWTNDSDVRAYHIFFDRWLQYGASPVVAHNKSVAMVTTWNATYVPVDEGIPEG